MLQRIIDFSLRNKFFVLLATVVLVFGGVYAARNIPLDAIPDLSDTQVIIYTPWEGQAPNIVEDQVTYPITTKMLSVPKAKTVRGYSFYGFSFVYVIFEDGTDPYWARSRVLEYLSSIGSRLPKGVAPSLGPDATGVGWAFMYSLNSTNRDLAELRSIQDWYLKYQLTAVPGVSEVASVGGFEKQYQVTVDPTKLRAYNLALKDVSTAIERSNGEVGGRSLELAEREFILRVKGYITSLADLKKIAVGIGDRGVPILLRDVATIQFGPDMRRGIAEANGQGETVGGIVVVRYGANAYQVIQDVKAKLATAMKALPADVKVTVNYDRSELIDHAVKTLKDKLIEESIVVALVCLAFLLHLRSALVAIIILPVAVLIALLVMFGQGITSNIMSLGGIAIAIGAMVDAVIIMIENAHKHLERDQGKKPHWEIIRDAAVEVGPTLFYSLLVITVSFLPVFTLQEQEGRLFKPLAFTKTYSMAAAALLSITLAPVLMGWFIRGKIPSEEKNPLNRLLIWIYNPVLDFVVKWRWAVIFTAGVIIVWVFLPWNWMASRVLPEGKLRDAAFSVGKLFPYQNIGSEFMPPLYEGDLLYMPTTFPGISPTKAKELLQVTDRLIKSFPEVAEVFGKAGRAETATDPAPLDMIETTIRLKPESEWPAVDIVEDDSGAGFQPASSSTNSDTRRQDARATTKIVHRKRTPDELTDALNNVVQIPGLNNAWTMPIRTRIDMLSTGIKTPVGIKIAGADLATLERIGTEVEAVVRKVPGTTSVFAERVMGGRFIEFEIDREAIARYGLTLADVQDVLSVALGGMALTTTVEGLQRYTINLRYDRDFRSDLRALREDIVVPTPTGAQIPLGQLATVKVVDGPMGIKSEGAVPNAWVYVDIRGVDVGTYVQMAMRAVNEALRSGDASSPKGVGDAPVAGSLPAPQKNAPGAAHPLSGDGASPLLHADAIHLPPGYNIFWSGQYEYMLRAKERLMIVVPLTLLLITLIIYLNTKSAIKTAIVMLAVPFSLVGAFWAIYLCGYNLSVAVWVGIIALAGLDAETGVVMLLYLDLAFADWKKRGALNHTGDLRDAIYHGAVKRVRPKAMTACVIIAGLAPILWSHGAGADVMKRIATPMVGGVITSTIMELAVYPAIYFLWRSRGLQQKTSPA